MYINQTKGAIRVRNETIAIDNKMKEEITEIVSVFMDLPKTDRMILLSNANAFKTLRNIEKQQSKEGS